MSRSQTETDSLLWNLKGRAVSAERELDRTSANPFLTVGCRVTAKSEERGRIFVCGLSYRLRMKTSAGSLNRELNLRTCSIVSFRCPARNMRSEEHTSELQSHHDLVC